MKEANNRKIYLIPYPPTHHHQRLHIRVKAYRRKVHNVHMWGMWVLYNWAGGQSWSWLPPSATDLLVWPRSLPHFYPQKHSPKKLSLFLPLSMCPHPIICSRTQEPGNHKGTLQIPICLQCYEELLRPFWIYHFHILNIFLLFYIIHYLELTPYIYRKRLNSCKAYILVPCSIPFQICWTSGLPTSST